jgi:hypothetical protein
MNGMDIWHNMNMYPILYTLKLRHDVTYDIIVWHIIYNDWCLMQPHTKQLVILLKIWCGKIMSITLCLICVILPHDVYM